MRVCFPVCAVYLRARLLSFSQGSHVIYVFFWEGLTGVRNYVSHLARTWHAHRVTDWGTLLKHQCIS